MTAFIISIVCLVLAFIVVMIRKAYFSLPFYELKRQAANGDKFAKTVFPIVSYNLTLRALLWLMLGVLSATAIILIGRVAPLLIGIILVGGWLWLAFSWLPNSEVSATSKSLAIAATPVFAWLMHWTYPLLKWLGKVSGKYRLQHTGLYESEDLYQTLIMQEAQTDNRISPTQIGRLKKLLAFETALVKDYQKPWGKTMKLSAQDPIGPKLLDDMHKSGQTVFPVLKTKTSKTVVGITNKEDIGLKTEGTVGDHMKSPVRHLDQDESMESALAKFAMSGHTLFLVSDDNDDIVGTLTLRDALGSILAPETKGKRKVAETVETQEAVTDHDINNLEEINESTE